MVFESTITERGRQQSVGDFAFAFGTYTNGGGDSGGDIDTGLKEVHVMILQPGGGSVIASAPSVDETLPFDGSAVTVVNTTGEDGQWFAIGR